LADERTRFDYDPAQGSAAATKNRAWLVRALFLTRTGRRVLLGLAALTVLWLALR
jgi:hypothetical protein